MISLSRLESRLKHEIPPEYHQEIEKQVSRFESEISRLSFDEDKIGQATLTESEIDKLPIGNQNSDKMTLIEYQCIKAAAIKYGVSDWIMEIDTSLTYEENIDVMRKQGNRRTMREMEEYKQQPTDYYVGSPFFTVRMKSENDIKKAFALAAKAADDLEESQPAQAAGPYILMKGLGWVLDKEVGEDLYEDMEEEFKKLLEEDD